MLTNLKKILNAQASLYDQCNFQVNSFMAENESAEYYAHSYCLENRNIRFRIAKKTPTKTGWFVTMWKRIPGSVIAPYDSLDPVDFFVINILHQNRMGQFIFPKSILVEKNIFSINGRGGKRAIRVYSPWDEANNKQAVRTKKWQGQFFVDITKIDSVSLKRVRDLYTL